MIRRGWATDLVELFLPTGCVACGGWIPSREAPAIVCVLCRTRLHDPGWPRCPRCHHPRGTGRIEEPDCLECRAWPAELTGARYAYGLIPPADDLVHALKYEGWREVSEFMGVAMARAVSASPRVALDPVAGRAPTVVPIPTTLTRIRSRGYNQAHLLADTLARTLGLTLRDALTRPTAPRSQTSLSPTERRENVRGAFQVTPGGAPWVRGAPILLVDDVLTTGATAAEAAVTLSGAGAGPITLVTFARALPQQSKKAA
ncbi:MAG: hypothetical protein O2958_13320 [Gemmatimonadetes bacterium]|nr:hypothetical protein [Gemmatimonadota bacterium]